MAAHTKDKGVSLVKGPVAILGLAALVYGVTGLIFGGRSFGVDIPSGTISGETWLGLEGNGWTNLLFIGAGALLTFGAPLHWAAKSMSTIVGLALGAASIIALVDGDDVLGIFAANGLTALVWGAAAAVLLVLTLLPRVGGGKDDETHDRRPAERDRERDRTRVRAEPQRESAVESDGRLDGNGDGDVDRDGARAARESRL